MCNPTKQPPRRELYELGTQLTANTGGFLVPDPARRWVYQGTETHYGYTYHLWQNVSTQKKFAWETEAYKAATKETASA